MGYYDGNWGIERPHDYETNQLWKEFIKLFNKTLKCDFTGNMKGVYGDNNKMFVWEQGIFGLPNYWLYTSIEEAIERLNSRQYK